jgi:hypothetical protein
MTSPQHDGHPERVNSSNSAAECSTVRPQTVHCSRFITFVRVDPVVDAIVPVLRGRRSNSLTRRGTPNA